MNNKKTFVRAGLGVLGVAMLALGIAPPLMLPPIITGVGFLLIAWAWA